MSSATATFCTAILAVSAACIGPPTEVVGVTPAWRDIEFALITNGRVEATSRVAVHAPVAGRVEQVLVRRGDKVARGQVLLRIADTGQAAAESLARARLGVAEARLAGLQAGLDPVEASLLQAERGKLVARRESLSAKVERLDRLVSRAAAPLAELEAAQRSLGDVLQDLAAIDLRLEAPPSPARLDELRAEATASETTLRAAAEATAKLSVRAPLAGVVYSLRVVDGDFVSAGGLAARIGSLDPVRVRIFVDEPDLGRVAVGDRARIRADAFPSKEWQCTVDRIATEVVDLGTRRVGEVLCTVRNADLALLPNLAVRVRIVTDRAEQALSVPRSSVQNSNEEAFVWIMDQGRASRRKVEVGVQGPDFVEIRSGLDSSDAVIAVSSEQFAEGQRVRMSSQRGGD